MRLSFRSIAWTSLAFAWLVGPTPTRAALVTFTFSGTITTIDDPRNIFGGAVHLGDAYTGTLIYDSAAKGSTPDPTVSFYNYSNSLSVNPLPAPLGMVIQIGSSITIGPARRDIDELTLGVYNNARTTMGTLADGFDASQEESFFNGTTIQSELFLGDRSAQVYSSTALPTSLAAGNFTDGSFAIRDLNDVVNTTTLARRVLFGGTVNGINPNSTPEPASLILLGSGLMGCWCYRRVSARRSSQVGTLPT